MTSFQRLREAFEFAREAFLASPGLRRLADGKIGVAHYASYLRQVFHHTRENPQIQALATVYFRGHQRGAIERFFRHASSEIGHDQLALKDLRTLGFAIDALPFQNPLPETSAVIAFPFYQIQNLSPVGYLGYLCFLQFLPQASGSAIMDALERVGVTRAAMRFLRDHSSADLAYTQRMESYAETLITDERELGAAVYAMRATGRLYASMIEAAFAYADAPIEYGVANEELPPPRRDI